MSGNATILLIDQGLSSYEKIASHRVLGAVFKEAFFTELRTKQQTGYIAASPFYDLKGELLQGFVVQSTTHYCEELLARYELFLEEFTRTMEKEISKERFAGIKTSLAQNLKIPTENLHSYTREQYELAFNKNGAFDRRQKIISSLEALDYDTFIEDARSFISRENSKRLAILISGKKVNEKSFSYVEVSAKELSAQRQ